MKRSPLFSSPSRPGVLFTLLAFALFLCSCEKFLDKKPNLTSSTLSNLKDIQLLLDNDLALIQRDPFSPMESADDYSITDADFLAVTTEWERNLITWKGDHTFEPQYNDYLSIYNGVNYANTALDALKKIDETDLNAAEYRSVKGHALFVRGRFFYLAASIWAQAYDVASAGNDLGIALRLNSNFNEKSVRSNLQVSYNQILADLKASAAMLPVNTPHQFRPGKAAAYAMLSRVCLSMRRYPEAEAYADSCLALRSSLLDYNTLSAVPAYPIPALNTEVITSVRARTPTLATYALVTPALYASYAVDDLRKSLFFASAGNGTYTFRGSYDGSAYLFSGLTTNEMVLNKAECLARRGLTGEAVSKTGELLVKRYKTGKYATPSITTPSQALAFVLTERRKELLFRDLRWTDIKRLNKENAGISLSRTVLGKTYQLPANDKRFALPLPEEVIDVSGMPQNP